MKKGLHWVIATAALAVVFTGAAQSEKAHGKSGAGHPVMCPMMIEGAVVQVVNVGQGVTIQITAQDPATVKKIQTAAEEMGRHHAMRGLTGAAKQGVYLCPMKCYTGPKTKDGRCPKCGMDLQKK